MANIDLVNQYGPEKGSSPEAYRHTAGKSVKQFNDFVQAIYKAGQLAATKGITNTRPGVNALQPGTGQTTSPVNQPKGKFSLKNLDANVTEHFASTERLV